MRGIGGRVLWVPQNLPSTSTGRHTGDWLVARVEDCNTENRAAVSNSCLLNFRFPRNLNFNEKVRIM